ncbi:MAG: hypothetical protein IT480_01100 [Gammaproteobacteria bacterium]|nr:hypothetical protein [Gammaproteobacteria bacterium]
MGGYSRQLLRAAVCAALLAIGLPVLAAKIVVGSGADPHASVTGIYELALLHTGAGRVHRVLALVHRGNLQEVHVRTNAGYLRRIAGSDPIRVSTGVFSRLLNLAGGTNHDVNPNSVPNSTRCNFYRLAGLGVSRTEELRWNCPQLISLDEPDAGQPTGSTPPGYPVVPPSSCPDGSQRVIFVNDDLSMEFRCLPTTANPLPRARAAPVSIWTSLFGIPVAYAWLTPEFSRTTYGVWLFGGYGSRIGWLSDAP